MSPLFFSVTVKMFPSVVNKIGNDRKPLQTTANEHKRSQTTSILPRTTK